MSIVVIGLNHRTVPLELLERMTVRADALPKALHDLRGRPNVAEAVLLSTCNRTEVYAVAERFHGAYQDIRDFLCEVAQLAPEDLLPHLYSQHDDDAVSHLFEVAAGLDSDVLGEAEILGQVRVAWEVAAIEGAARATLNLLFRHAVEVGKRARTETAIGRGTASVPFAAVEMAAERRGGLQGARVLVIGAGDMGEGLVSALHRSGADAFEVANRTASKALQLATRLGGRAVALEKLRDALERADIVLTSTGSGHPLITVDDAEAVMAARGSRPLLLVDIALPRDIDHAVGGVPGIVLLDLDDLRDWAAPALAARQAEATRVAEIVEEEVSRFVDDAAGRQAAPLVAALHERAESIRAAELDRFVPRLAQLDDRSREVVEAMTRAIVAKLLHDPSVRLRQAAGTPRGERNASAVRDLFDLP